MAHIPGGPVVGWLGLADRGGGWDEPTALAAVGGPRPPALQVTVERELGGAGDVEPLLGGGA